MSRDTNYKEWLRRNAAAYGGTTPGVSPGATRGPRGNANLFQRGTVSPGAGGGPRGSANISNTSGPSQAARDYLERLNARNEEGIANSRVTGSGTSSRAYANTQGAQRNMLPTPEIQARYDAANPSGSSYNNVGSAGGGGMAPSPEPSLESLLPTRTDIDGLYNKLIATLQGYGTNINTEFDASEKKIREQYDRSNVGLTGEFSNAQKNLELAKAGLGYGDTSAYQKNMDRITENADLSETADLSYLEKMKGARGIEMKDIMMGVERDRISQKNAQDLALQESMLQLIAARSGGSGGGGGGRGGGGSGGSTNTTGSETATETMTLGNAGIQAVYDSITDPTQKAAFALYIDQTMGNEATQAITADMKTYTDNAVTAKKPMSAGGGYANRFRNQQVGLAQNWLAKKITPLEQLRVLSRGGGSPLNSTPSVSRTVKSTGKVTLPKLNTAR